MGVPRYVLPRGAPGLGTYPEHAFRWSRFEVCLQALRAPCKTCSISARREVSSASGSGVADSGTTRARTACVLLPFIIHIAKPDPDADRVRHAEIEREACRIAPLDPRDENSLSSEIRRHSVVQIRPRRIDARCRAEGTDGEMDRLGRVGPGTRRRACQVGKW